MEEYSSLVGVANIFLKALFYDSKLDYLVPIINTQGEVRTIREIQSEKRLSCKIKKSYSTHVKVGSARSSLLLMIAIDPKCPCISSLIDVYLDLWFIACDSGPSRSLIDEKAQWFPKQPSTANEY